jgi:molybdopterin-guanine dinucleotide biosynthesis protein A
MGGADKTALPFGDGTVLDHLLDSLPADWPVVCVGESRHTHRVVTWTRESPPGGGPVAGMAAGLAVVDTPVCVLVAGDMPFAGSAAAHLASLVPLVAAKRGAMSPLSAATSEDGAVGVDGTGRAQPLLGAYRTDALRRAVPDEPGGTSLMAVVEALRVELVRLEDPACLDVDTPESLGRARNLLGGT